ncbi:hypothetical protein [Paracoccus sp. (in: a-proteobacteria)]|uniref:phage tail assembly chaperone n=1 Tax=Paracoccus sp. TaxID=267 RepID=UPI002AFE9786|nr:hypothetical protein [Paracoccus sp. (in: a-proteobacteria)]
MNARTRLSRQLCGAVTAALSGERVRPPEAGRPLWNAFQRLNATRSYHMAGPNPISFAEIDAFARLMRLPLEPWHITILMDMDAAWLAGAQKAKVPEGVKTLPPVSKHGISAALFDLVTG